MDIVSLPQEILSHVLSFLSPATIIAFGQTCKHAYDFISPRNQILWKCAFLHIFDDPNDAWSSMPGHPHLAQGIDWDWYGELVRRLLALQVIKSRYRVADEHHNIETHLNAILSILDTAKFAPTARDIADGKVALEDDRYLSLNLQIFSDIERHRDGLESLIHDSGSPQWVKYSGADGNPWNSPTRPVTRSMSYDEHEKSRPESASRLHVLYGLTVRERITHKARGAARRKVYDWSRVGPENEYGPLKRDRSGRVDWSLLEAVCSVIARNFEMCVEGSLAMPQGLSFSIPHRSLVDPTTTADWARVTGPWLGTYSFLDYADLFAFNAANNGQLGARPTLEEEPEAYGDLMKLELKLDDTISADPRLQTSLPISTDLPVLFFSGVSRAHVGIHRPTIGIRGCVCLVPGGREVRWRFIITYGGEDQWQLEGIQPGGIRSGGVYGLWTQCEHEDHGPVGPFCYFPAKLCKSTSVVLVA